MASEAKSKGESSFHTLWTQHGQRLSFHLSFLTHAGSGSCWKEHLSCNRLANPPLPGDLTQCGHSAETFLLLSLRWSVLCFLFLKVGSAAFMSFRKLGDLSVDLGTIIHEVFILYLVCHKELAGGSCYWGLSSGVYIPNDSCHILFLSLPLPKPSFSFSRME